MSQPKHYSLEIAKRCQRLIDQLTDTVGDDPKMVDEWGGPLRTTFILAMSTPMVVLPMERLFKPIFGRGGVADDSQLDESLEERVRDTFGDNRSFGAAPFFTRKTWSYVDAMPFFPVAEAWPQDAFDRLAAEEAVEAAAVASAADILKCLRNALSHGGIAYLDRDGRQSDEATDMLGFAAYPDLKRRDQLCLLRVSVDGYQEFLGAWSGWLTDSGLEAKLDHEGPGWFEAEQEAEDPALRDARAGAV